MSAQERAQYESCPWRTIRVPGGVASSSSRRGLRTDHGPWRYPGWHGVGGLVNGGTRSSWRKLGYGTQRPVVCQIDQYRNSISTFRSRPTPTNSRSVSERVELLFGRRLAAAA